ncbi:MAG: AAA family ATPase [Clostridia bacterium]|nr:AAA family ATPase [Clostridia bacterium]
MTIKKLVVKNYKLLKDSVIKLNPKINIFVGDNDAGKSTLLDALSIATTGKLNGIAFDRQLKANLFNRDIRDEFIANMALGLNPAPPRIIIEAYFDGDPIYQGTENELSEDAAGIRVVVDILDSNTEAYRQMLSERKVKDIPVELYGVTYHYFSGATVSFRLSPFKCITIDTTRKEYAGIVDHFVSDSISDNLTEDELTNLAVAYNASRRQFRENDVVQKLNDAVKTSKIIKGRTVSLDLREDDVNAWKKQMSIVVDEIPFEQIGFGTQNSIKIELALRNADNQANVVLMEEPENNLSFSNMTRLVKHVVQSSDKQVFISTHSSYIANKLDLGNVILVRDGQVQSYGDLPAETKRYFTKLPGYDTLRFALATRVVLVEGPTDDLIIQRAYKDKYGRLPFDDGIDIISVGSLAFKRFADIANLIGKDVVIVTDNDGDIDKNIRKKYAEYIEHDNLHFYYEENEHLNTIEPSVLAVNCDGDQPHMAFKSIISKDGSLESRDYTGILDFMKGNKVEWAFRVFESESSICYPQYIQDAINFFE